MFVHVCLSAWIHVTAFQTGDPLGLLQQDFWVGYWTELPEFEKFVSIVSALILGYPVSANVTNV